MILKCLSCKTMDQFGIGFTQVETLIKEGGIDGSRLPVRGGSKTDMGHGAHGRNGGQVKDGRSGFGLDGGGIQIGLLG